MSTASAVLMVSGVVCLAVAGVAMHKLMPGEGKSTPSWTRSEMGGTTVALGTFVLMIAGLALLAKGFTL